MVQDLITYNRDASKYIPQEIADVISNINNEN